MSPYRISAAPPPFVRNRLWRWFRMNILLPFITWRRVGSRRKCINCGAMRPRGRVREVDPWYWECADLGPRFIDADPVEDVISTSCHRNRWVLHHGTDVRARVVLRHGQVVVVDDLEYRRG